MSLRPICGLALIFFMPFAAVRLASAQDTTRIEIRSDFSEADTEMAILAKRSASVEIPVADWDSEPAFVLTVELAGGRPSCS